jgi:hypothetical protein
MVRLSVRGDCSNGWIVQKFALKESGKVQRETEAIFQFPHPAGPDGGAVSCEKSVLVPHSALVPVSEVDMAVEFMR